MRWLGVKSRGSVVPTALELLRLVYIGRVCLAIAIYITTALKIRVAAPLDILGTSLMLVTAAAVTLASYWHTHFRRRLPGPTFLYLQALFDVLLITAVVHMTGGADSDLASLYVILIAVTALLMPPANAGLVTLFAGLVYFADVVWGHSATFSAGVWIQLTVFALVAVVTAYVATRVNVMGAEREALAGRCARCSSRPTTCCATSALASSPWTPTGAFCTPTLPRKRSWDSRRGSGWVVP